MNTDFEALKDCRSWLFFQTTDFHFQSGSIEVSDVFCTTFPKLALLIKRARILDISLKGQTYKLLSWDEKNIIKPMGWLCKLPAIYPNLPFAAEHRLLSDNIGGICEAYYNHESESFDMNQNFMFIPAFCSLGLDGTREGYEFVCGLYKKQPIPTEHYLKFAHEAGGILSFYDPESTEVVLYAADHSLKYLKQFPDQPDYTFYTINGVKTFTDYVETLAQQWLDWVK